MRIVFISENVFWSQRYRKSCRQAAITVVCDNQDKHKKWCGGKKRLLRASLFLKTLLCLTQDCFPMRNHLWEKMYFLLCWLHYSAAVVSSLSYIVALWHHTSASNNTLVYNSPTLASWHWRLIMYYLTTWAKYAISEEFLFPCQSTSVPVLISFFTLVTLHTFTFQYISSLEVSHMCHWSFALYYTVFYLPFPITLVRKCQ